MKVAEIARRAGVGVHAVRFYVRAGLLRAERDPSNNYKQFGEAHVLRLRFIKCAQSLGFSLAEIGALLVKMESGECTCDAMHLQLADKLLELQREIEQLQMRQAFMQRVYEDWHAEADVACDLERLCRFLEQRATQRCASLAADQGVPPAHDLETSRADVSGCHGERESPRPGGKRAPQASALAAGQRCKSSSGRAVGHLLTRPWGLSGRPADGSGVDALDSGRGLDL